MARHRVPAKDLAGLLGISKNAVSNLRNSEVMPRIDGKRLEELCVGVSKLSKIGEVVTPYDLLEYVPQELNLPGDE